MRFFISSFDTKSQLIKILFYPKKLADLVVEGELRILVKNDINKHKMYKFKIKFNMYKWLTSTLENSSQVVCLVLHQV